MTDEQHFNHGYFIAVSNYYILYSDKSVCRQLLLECGLTMADTEGLDLPELDVKNLTEIFHEDEVDGD